MKWFSNRPIEEYHPNFEEVLAKEWSMIQHDFLMTHGYPIERDYGYVRDRYYNDAKENARNIIKSLRGFE